GTAPARIEPILSPRRKPAMQINPADISRAADILKALRDEVGKAVVGQREVVDQTLIALVASGHVLIEGVPGLGKTLLARAFAKALTLNYARVQFTPDLMPSDITGHAVLDTSQGHGADLGSLRVLRGPVFTNLPLAGVMPRLDERNVLSLQKMAAFVRVDDRVVDYAVRITRATRTWPGVANGAGSRGAIALVRAARAAALLDVRDFVTPDDIKRYALPVLRHRVLLAPDAQLEGRKIDELLATMLDRVEAPRL